MAKLGYKIKLSVIIPCLNEARNLPLLLADIYRYKEKLDVLIIDAGSTDSTIQIANIWGAKVISLSKANRGFQLNVGARNSIQDWLLFIHSDSRLPNNWFRGIESKLKNKSSYKSAWFFKFKINSNRIDFKLLELAVFIRSHIFKRPYGDQGLLIRKELYKQIGGYNDLAIMEDIDLLLRLNNNIKYIGVPIYTSTRKWQNVNIIKQAWRNLILRIRWKNGEDTYKLADEYYNK